MPLLRSENILPLKAKPGLSQPHGIPWGRGSLGSPCADSPRTADQCAPGTGAVGLGPVTHWKRGGWEGGGEVHPLGAVGGGLVKEGRKPEVQLLKGCSEIQAPQA